ncbi:MAG: spore germination protein [Clostridia bacterium]|nr:spore germination protein [Clostridia bacterium]
MQYQQEELGIPFPVLFEILIMEISFELLREASLRIPSPMGSTVGIIGGLILRRSSCISEFSKSSFNNYCSNNRHMLICDSRLLTRICLKSI